MESVSRIEGVDPDWPVETVPFTAGDGFGCNLLHIHGREAPVKGPVLLVHGAGVRANIFAAPSGAHIIRYLVERGWDVWLENWRASIDLPFNRWTLDHAAAHDHPQAVKIVSERTGTSHFPAIIHCQGSTSFTMALVAGLLPQIKTVVSNAVSLHTVVPWLSKAKLNYAVPLASPFVDHLNPQWGLWRSGFMPHFLNTVVRLTHHECENLVCKHVSFAYGTGWPALWSHENLNPETHEWLKAEFAKAPMTFFSQMSRCVNAGHLVAVEGYKELPKDFAAQAPQTDARIAFFCGRDNLCFLPESQRRSYEFFLRTRKDHAFYELPGYGHLDIFMGKNAARDVFPADYATQYNLAMTLHHKGDEVAAIPEFEKAIALAPGEASFHLSLAASLEKAGRVPDAKREYQQYLEMAPNSVDAEMVKAHLQGLT